MKTASRTACFTQSWTLGVTNWRWYKTWGDDCVTYSVFYTKLDARCDKLALVVMKTARLLRHVQRVLHKAGRSV